MSDMAAIINDLRDRLSRMERRIADLEESGRAVEQGGIPDNLARIILGGPEELKRENRRFWQEQRRRSQSTRPRG